MEKRGVTDHRHNPPLLFGRKHANDPRAIADRSPHADTGIHGIERRHEAEGVTTYITGNIGVGPVKQIEYAAVRAAGTHIRGTGWQRQIRCTR